MMRTLSHLMNTSVLAWLAVVLSTGLSAQSPLEIASRFAESGSWDEAYAALKPSMQQELYQTDAHAWYVLGFVQKELHKASGATGDEAVFRAESVQSFQRALSMPSLSSEERETARRALDFLSRSYFRDAIQWVEGFTPTAEPIILELMGRYEAIQSSLNPGQDLSPQRADLHRYLGQAYAQLLETERFADLPEERVLFERATAHYQESLTHDPDSYASQYNSSIALYNHGVRQLKRINHTTSMFELLEIQDACVELFERALIPMRKAHEQRPTRLETLKGLMTIHYALSQPEASEAYRVKIEQQLRNR